MRCDVCHNVNNDLYICFSCRKFLCFNDFVNHEHTVELANFFVESPDSGFPSHHRSISMAQYTRPGGVDSTKSLALINANASMSGWSGSNDNLSNAHHIFPKSPLVWLFEHMTMTQQQLIIKRLSLPRGAGGMALTRLRSNLISADHQGMKIRPEWRVYDPHKDRELSPAGEEFLDLLRTQSGGLDARSCLYKCLGLFVSQIIIPRFFACERNPQFKLTNGEVTVVANLIFRAEVIHYHLEDEPGKPTMHNKAFSSVEGGLYRKNAAPEVSAFPSWKSLKHNYRKIKKEEFERNKNWDDDDNDDPPRLRLFKSERLGGFTPRSTLGWRNKLRNKCKDQLEVDICSALCRLIRLHSWTEKSIGGLYMDIICAAKDEFQKCYDNQRKIAHQAYLVEGGGRNSHRLLPSVTADIDRENSLIIILLLKPGNNSSRAMFSFSLLPEKTDILIE